MSIFNAVKNKIYFLVLVLRKWRLYSLLRIDILRFILCWIRKYHYIYICKNLRIWDGSQLNLAKLETGFSTIQHNLNGLHNLSSARSLRVIKPLSVIESYRPLQEMPLQGGELHDLDYPSNAKVLTIGPRTEGEIFCLIGYGFKPSNIRGLDLISYSPFIDIGDMHNMPYAADSFDIVICSCVLVYSINPKLACKEILRVCKNDGLICIAQDTGTDTGKAHMNILGKQTILTQDYLNLFEGNIKKVFFQHEFPERLNELPINNNSKYTMSLIFQLKK